MSDAEKNYHLHSGKLEFLALKWAVTDRFADYLRWGQHPFNVYTDNNPLTYVLSSAKLNAVGMRWVNELANFNFSIHYKPGKTNIDADYLSRNPTDIAELQRSCSETVDSQCLGAVMSGVEYGGPVMAAAVVAEKLMLRSDSDLPTVSRAQMMEAQMNDEVVGPVYRSVVAGHRPNRRLWSEFGKESRVLMRSFSKLKVREGILCRDTPDWKQVVLPACYHHLVYEELHQKMGHVGVEKVCDLAQKRFYWPRMYDDVKKFVQKKCRCVANKEPNVKVKAPLHPIAAQAPFEMVSIDLIELDPCKGGFKYGLVVIDHFTRFCNFYALRTKSTKAVAQKMFNEFILQWGFPSRIHHDKGPEFNSNLFKELHRLTGIKASNTTPYYPQGDGQCERLNRTLVNMIKTLAKSEKADWRAHLPKLQYAVNSTRNKTTGFSPHYLMFGREAVLPIDEVFRGIGGTSTDIVKSHREFVVDWENSMKTAYDIARKNINKSATYNKQHYDKHAKAAALQVGDQVLVRNMREKTGKPKMRSYYEENIFKVVEVRAEVPVYKIQNLKKAKDVRVVHRNKLLKVDELPLDMFDDIKDTPTPKQNTKKRESKPKEKAGTRKGKASDMKEKEKVIEEHLDVEESESDEEYAVIEERLNVQVDLRSGSDSEPEEIVTSVTPENENFEEVMQRDENVEESEPSDPDDIAVVVDPDATIPWDDPAALVMEREQDDEDVSLSEGVVADSQEDESVHASDTLSSSELDRGGLQGDTTVPEYGVEESVFDMDGETAESGTESDAQSDGGSGVSSDVSEQPGTGDHTEDHVGTDGEDEELEDSPQNIRQSSRGRIPRRMFTFDNLGGNPTREELA